MFDFNWLVEVIRASEAPLLATFEIYPNHVYRVEDDLIYFLLSASVTNFLNTVSSSHTGNSFSTVCERCISGFKYTIYYICDGRESYRRSKFLLRCLSSLRSTVNTTFFKPCCYCLLSIILGRL